MTLNDEILEYVVHKVKTHFVNDVDLVLAYGSHVTEHATATSDVDVCLVVNNQRGFDAVENFIIDGIGYDVWAMDWDRLTRIAGLEESLAPIVGRSKIQWARSKEVEQKFRSLEWKMDQHLKDSKYSRERQREIIRAAEDLLPRVWEKQDVGVAREGAAYIMMLLAEAFAYRNGTYLKRGVSDWRKEVRNLPLSPRRFLSRCEGILKCTTEDGVLESTYQLILESERSLQIEGTATYLADNHVTDVYWPSSMSMAVPSASDSEEYFYATESTREVDPNLDYRRAAWWYEEEVSNFNKLYRAIAENDRMKAFLTAAILQKSMRNDVPASWVDTDFLIAWSSRDLGALEAKARHIEALAIEVIEAHGVSIRRVGGVQDLYLGEPLRAW